MNKVALVTGSSRGIGKATIIEFAKKGYDVIINYVNSAKAASELKDEVESKYKIKALTVKADLSKEEDVREMVRKSLAEFKKVDVLVNNAGIALYDEVANKTMSDWHQSLQTNLLAPFLLSQLLGKEMVENKYGKIINISSIDAIYTYNAQSMEYDASKAALINMTYNYALELQPYVNVNCVAPGWVDTDMNKDLPQEMIEYQKDKICKHRFAKPEEVAKLITFLASDDAEFINSEIIKIDGGYKLG
ncbi:MAG: SDR family oxidoreductase [Thomasclavelia sp.]|nr:SDR family oxidoreductase [Thomasclavelia sp.]